MKIREITTYLESIAPLAFQESYDNSGLLVGNENEDVTGILVTLDCIEKVVDEAIAKGCNLIIAHHPIIFSGLKKLNGKNYIERTIIKAIKHNIAIYAIHTNLDNVHNGVNAKIGDIIGLQHTKVLQPITDKLCKLVTFVPHAQAKKVRAALFAVGAGHIGNYAECSFNTEGYGTFTAQEDANPYIGSINKQHQEQETRVEVVFLHHLQSKIIATLKEAHPYEEVAYDIYTLANHHPQVGAGMIGILPEAMDESVFLHQLKQKMRTECVRHTALQGKQIKTVVVCGGSGSFLLKEAIAQGADIFITADFKYHQFFDADNRIVIADIGHYESEQFTKDLLHDLLTKKFLKFALHLSEVNTNPINYL